LGIKPADIEELKITGAEEGAEIIRGILSGKQAGQRKDIVVINAAAAIIAGNLADDFEAAIKKADESVSSGEAMKCLEKLIEVSNG